MSVLLLQELPTKTSETPQGFASFLSIACSVKDPTNS